MAMTEETMTVETQATEVQSEQDYYVSDSTGTELETRPKDNSDSIDFKSALIGGAITAAATAVAIAGKKVYDWGKGKIEARKLKKSEKDEIEKLKAELAAVKAGNTNNGPVVEVKPEDIKPEEEQKSEPTKEPDKKK